MIIEMPDGFYDLSLSHEDLMYRFDPRKIKNFDIGNPAIYNSWCKMLSKKHENNKLEFKPKTVLNENDPGISDINYLDEQREKYLMECLKINKNQ